MRKQFNENQKQQREKLANKHEDEAIFKVKNNAALNEKLKRKTKDESYINLPDSYFKANQLPDLSLFKVPAIPPTKRQKIEILPNTVNTSNFTLASLFSGDFKPQKFSTPIEKEKQVEKTEQPLPLIADPNDILGSFENLQFHEEGNQGTDKNATKEIDQMKNYYDLVDEASAYIDSACFDDIEDPIEIIEKKISNKHEDASQSPRPSLISPCSIQDMRTAFSELSKETKQTPSWPVPVFYDQPKEEETFDDRVSVSNNHISSQLLTKQKLLSFLDEKDKDDLGISVIDDEEASSSLLSAFNFTPHPSANTYLASTQSTLTPYPSSPNYGICDNLDWLESKFASSMDMTWESGSDFTISPKRNHLDSDLSAIFRSPPKSNCLEFKKPFSRTIERPKKYNRSESDDSSYKGDEFSWWFSDSDSVDNSFDYSDTQDLFNTKYSMF
jgi:hypothetical protein